MEMHESLQSLMKFDATPLMLHYLNQSSFKHQYLSSPPPSDNHIHFIPYGLLQPTDANTVKNQTTQQNRFLAQTGIVPIFNITPETMQSGLKDSVLERISVIGFEPTYLTTKSGKWLVIVKTTRNDQAKQEIDQVINDTIFPDSQVDKPRRSIDTTLTQF